jgi:RHS repeat-associated protein
MDDQQRIALVRVGDPFDPLDSTPAVQYHLGDHLGSSNLVIDSNGGWINREEYKPYGETSLGSFRWKRYRITGKERDEESGLYYYGARYYATWLMRWMSCDPSGKYDTLNLYEYVKDSPLARTDLTGKESLLIAGSANNVRERQQFYNSALGELYRLKKKGEDNLTIIVFKYGYSENQIEAMKKITMRAGGNLVAVDSREELINYINTKRTKNSEEIREVDKIKNIVIFSYGFPEKFAFGYLTLKASEYEFEVSHIERLRKEAFEQGDFYIHSFACRTGLSPQKRGGLAQVLANQTGHKVIATKRRTNYENIYGGRFERWDTNILDKVLDGIYETPVGSQLPPQLKDGMIQTVDGMDFWVFGAPNQPEIGSTPVDAPGGWHVFYPIPKKIPALRRSQQNE